MIRKVFVLAWLSILLPLAAWGADGDTFTARVDASGNVLDDSSSDGLVMTFRVISESEHTCQVGEAFTESDYNDNMCAVLKTANSAIVIPSEIKGYTVVTIGYGAFKGCSITGVTIPSSVKTIGNSAFLSCYSLITVNLAEGLTDIEANAFTYCHAITALQIPESVESIGSYAFSSCSGITNTSLTISKNLKELASGYDNNPFAGWPSLASITVDPNNAYFDSRDNCNAIIRKSDNRLVTGCVNTTIPSTVTSIGYGAFEHVPLTELVVPENVLSIGSFAFMGCEQLATVSLPSRLEEISGGLFSGCTSLVNVTIPNRVTAIDMYAFNNCSALASIEIPVKVQSIGREAFAGCTSLNTVTSYIEVPQALQSGTFPDNLNAQLFVPYGKKTTYQGLTEWNKFTTITEMEAVETSDVFVVNTQEGIPVTYTIIDRTAMTCCVGYADGTSEKTAVGNGADLTGTLTIPSTVSPSGSNERYTVKEIGKYAFYNCSNLTSIVIPDGVEDIGVRAFYRCRKLASLTLPQGLKTIDQGAFMECETIESFNIPEHVISIGWGIFSGCAKLSTITVSEGNTIFSSPDNCNAVISGRTLIAGCKNTTIPITITTIGEYAMKNLINATIVIPDNITEIRYMGFMDLRNSSITLPSTAVTIGDHAFGWASNTTFLSRCQNPAAIHKDAFTTIDAYKPTLVLKVPKGTKDAYSSATGWKEISTIEELPGVGDSFTAKTIEGIEMMFKVIDANQKTIQVGDGTGAAIAETTAVHVTIPSVVNDYTVVSIGDMAFYVCRKMSGISIPASVTQISGSAFSECLALSLISMAATNPFDIDPSTFCNYSRPLVIVPAGTVDDYKAKQGWSQFSRLSDEQNIQFANAAMKNICVAKWDTDNDGELSYLEAAAVKEVSGLFRNNYDADITSFEEFRYFISVQKIDYYGTFTQNHLEKLCIPASVSEIRPGAFEGCPKLWAVTIDEMNEYYAVADTVLYKKDMKTLVACLASKKGEFEIPSGVVEIGDQAFASCPEITSVVIPASVTSIGPECFGENAPSIKVMWTEPIQIHGSEFARSGDMTLFVPYGTKSAYQAADWWKEFGTIKECAADHAVIKAKSYSRVYGESNPSFGFDVVGQEITGTPAVSCDATLTSPVGTYDILISRGTVSADNAEYINGTLTITKAPLKITAKSYTRKQGEANPEFGVTYEGLKNNETASVLTTQPTISCSATESSPAGTYEITVSGASAANYDMSYIAGTLTIEAVKPTEDTPTEPEAKEENEFTEQDVSFEKTECLILI